jgi:hypothetical protein
MKFIAYWECEPDSIEDVLVKLRGMSESSFSSKGSELGRSISPSFVFPEGNRGFQLFQSDDIVEVMNFTSFYLPEVKWQILPIVETDKAAEKFTEKS